MTGAPAARTAIDLDDSHFRHDLMVAKTTPEARYNLLHNRLTVCRPGGRVQRHSFTAKELERTLAETFGLPVKPEWRPLYERAVTAGSR